MDDGFLARLGRELVSVGGVVAVALGGSRARGTHRPDSDIDLGLYYRGELDLTALRALAAETADGPADVTPPGGWGPWVNGPCVRSAASARVALSLSGFSLTARLRFFYNKEPCWTCDALHE
jgi:hypothetical protein